MNVLHRFLDLVFPRKCVLCCRLLRQEETDLCSPCRREAPVFTGRTKAIPFVSAWTAAYFYEGHVRASLLRYKFSGRQNYATAYGRILAARILRDFDGEFDLITYVPVSFQRRLQRGYDQVLLLARATARELGRKPVRILRKRRHNPAQSSLGAVEQRRANVQGAYRVPDPALVAGKRILMIDDIITTGATVSECAKMLQLAGAGEVRCAALAARRDRPK